MEKTKYKDLYESHSPKENGLYNGMLAFIIGGAMGVMGQGILSIYQYFNVPLKEASTFTIITLIAIASLFTALGFFDKWVSVARAGLLVPITGFAHAMTSATMEYRREGLILGIGSNIFKLTGSVILYGVVSAYVFGLIRLIVMGG